MSGNIRRRLIVALIVVLTCGIGWAVYALLHEDQPATSSPNPTEQGTEFAKPKLVGWSKGKRQWMVEAARMNDAGDTVTLEEISHGVLYKDGKEYLNFKAGRGVWQKAGENQGGGDLTLTGNVTVFRGKEQVFSTEQLIWQGARQMLVAPQSVSFAYEGSTATASGLKFNAVTEDVSLTGEVRVAMNDGTRATVHGELIYNLKTGSFQVKGDQEFEFST